jgi:hypothetical protein
MSLLGTAALAMWWDLAPAVRAEFEHWHSHEHFPERLGIPGFRRASRWTSPDAGEGMFMMYELEDFEVLSSPAYMARLNAPTPWSTRMMPHHRNMVRSQCRVLESCGGYLGRRALTIRMSPAAGREDALRGTIRSLGQQVAMRPGLTGLHLLRHESPAIALTEEQKMRGLADKAADWVLIASGYDAAALNTLAASEFGDERLVAMGAAPGALRQTHALSYSATPPEVAAIHQPAGDKP